MVQGADLKTRYRNDATALILVTARADEPMLKLLLEKGADVNAKAQEGTTALMVAAASGHEKLVRMLVRAS